MLGLRDLFSAEVASDLPEGWISGPLGDIVRPSIERVEPQTWPDVPYLGLEHVEANTGRIIGKGVASDVKSTKTIFHAGDVLYGKLRPYLNKVCIPDFDGICSTDFLVFQRKPELDNRYLMRWLMLPSVVGYANHHMAGVELPRISFEKLAELEFPLPPLAEQVRIADQLDDLYQRLDSSREGLARAKEIVNRFRQSVLAAACSGRLTEVWRKTRSGGESAETMLKRSRSLNVTGRMNRRQWGRGTSGLAEIDPPLDLPATWTVQRIKRLVEDGAILEFQDGNHGELYPRKADFGSQGVPFITATQVVGDHVRMDEAPLLSHRKAAALRIGLVKSDDVLLTHNATVGRVAVVPTVVDTCVIGTSVTYYRCHKEFLHPHYLAIAMRAPFWQTQLRMVMEQTTRNQVSIMKQAELWLAVPPIDEQIEIVRQTSGLFDSIDLIHAHVSVAEERVDRLGQAVLAKAFRGELVATEAELMRRRGSEVRRSVPQP
jgi:type I restriction enzyme S subunit